MANHEIELQVAPMSDETMDYLDILFSVCKRFNTDYYHATQKERDFIDAVASHEGQQRASVPPFLGIVRSERSDHMPA